MDIDPNAMIQELVNQRGLMGDRAAQLAGLVAALEVENKKLVARVKELENNKAQK